MILGRDETLTSFISPLFVLHDLAVGAYGAGHIDESYQWVYWRVLLVGLPMSLIGAYFKTGKDFLQKGKKRILLPASPVATCQERIHHYSLLFP